MNENLDRNLRKLLRLAPRPEAPRAGAEDRIFQEVQARLAREKRPRKRVRLLAWAAAVAAALLVVTALWNRPAEQPTRIGQKPTTTEKPIRPGEVKVERVAMAPAAGAPATRELKDGSTIEVAGGSRAAVTTWSDRNRPLVELEAGEVSCRVAKGPGTFRVKTPLGEAAALGTEYKVTLKEQPAEGGADMTRKAAALVMAVAVLSGEVLVSGPDGFEKLCVAGESVTVGKGGAPVENFRSGQLVPRLADGRQGEPLEVRNHTAQVTIRDQIALIEVDQVFFNPSAERVEGTFYFPLPSGATICRLALYVGDNLMEGEMAEAARARRTFEALKVLRVDPALLEWAGGNNFKMRVFPIEPKSEKRVLISYYQILEKENDALRFTYPLVSDALQTHPVGKLEVKVTLDSTPPIAAVATPNQATKLQNDLNHAEAAYTDQNVRPEKDFVLDCKLAHGQGELVVLPFWQGKDGDGYFLMIFSPKLETFESRKEAGNRFVFVLDKSGGLGARHLSLAVRAVQSALGHLKAGDLFGIVAYDTFAQTFRPALAPKNDENVQAAFAWLTALKSVGASDLTEAWNATAALAGTEPTQVVYVGSGLSSLTSTKSGKLLQSAAAAFAQAQVQIHALPLGTIQDTDFLGELVKKYNGTVRPIAGVEDMNERVAELMTDYGAPLYSDVKAAFEGVKVDEIYPRQLPNVTAGRQLFVFGKYLEQGQAKVKLTANYKDRPYEKEFQVAFGASTANTCVPPLWATRKIETLQRETTFAEGEAAQAIVRTVVELSKRYTVMSQYTSFLVLETPEDYVRYGIERRVREFGPYAGTGGVSAAEQLQALEQSVSRGLKPGFGGQGTGEARKAVGLQLEKAKGDEAGGAEAAGEGGEHFGVRSGGGRRQMVARGGGRREEEQLGERLAKEPASEMNALVKQQQAAQDAMPASNRTESLRRAAAPPAPTTPAKAAADPGLANAAFAFKRLADRDKNADGKANWAKDEAGDFETDVLAWARQDIFPAIEQAPPNYTSNWPGNWKRSPAEAMQVLRDLATRVQSFTAQVTAYRVEADGKEVKEGREWVVVFDTASGRYISHRVGEDSKDVCDGARLARFFPLLKYAATRSAAPQDVKALAAALPGFLVPWPEKLDWEHTVTLEKGDAGLTLKLASRNDQWSYVRVFLETEKGPVTKIEVYQHRWQNNKHSAVLAQTIACEEFQELGGVKTPTVFRVTNLPTDPAAQASFDAQRKELEAALAQLRAAGQDAAAKEVMAKIARPQGAASQVVRLTEVKVNFQPEADGFKIEMPKDWAVRDLDAQPKPNERRAISQPIDPSQDNFGRQPMRRGLRE
jgi:hypothetical protein